MNKRSHRILICLAVAGLTGYLSVLLPYPIHYMGIAVGDIGPPLRILSQSKSEAPAFGLSTDKSPLTAYPFTASLLLSPLLSVPLAWIAPVFNGVSSGILAYASLSAGNPWRLMMMASVPILTALHSMQ